MTNQALVRAAGLFLATALIFGAVALSADSVLAQAVAVAFLSLAGLVRILAASVDTPSDAPVRARR
ncbi:MAG: hypothetical protein EA385_15425 [Salinarimonadaceae bacterium]|nr:MAG: hypothetical protein EA385_15425 [Salinarimonadaceae bacterium]